MKDSFLHYLNCADFIGNHYLNDIVSRKENYFEYFIFIEIEVRLKSTVELMFYIKAISDPTEIKVKFQYKK